MQGSGGRIGQLRIKNFIEVTRFLIFDTHGLWSVDLRVQLS